MIRKIREKHPHAHARYIVMRDGVIFTATPCYGLHDPWWIVKTMDGEANPVAMRDDDQWMSIDDHTSLWGGAGPDCGAELLETAKDVEWNNLVESKIGEFNRTELVIGRGVTEVTSLPFEAPWMSPFGSCLIKITDIKRDDLGRVVFQLANESATPYEEGNAWAAADDFYSEWPD